jgi:hypothetical protein
VAGRPRGASSRSRSPARIAADHLNALIEIWLAGALRPRERSSDETYSTLDQLVTAVLRARQELGLLKPEHQALIEECWRERGSERRFTVPVKIKRKLCRLAIAYVVEMHQRTQAAAPQIEDSLQRARGAAEQELKRRGWSDAQIAAWFKKTLRAQRRSAKQFKAPDIDQVVAISDRRAPAVTLRRKADCRKLHK